MFDPEKVTILMDFICEEMALKSTCTAVCEKCPLNAKGEDALDKVVDIINNEL